MKAFSYNFTVFLNSLWHIYLVCEGSILVLNLHKLQKSSFYIRNWIILRNVIKLVITFCLFLCKSLFVLPNPYVFQEILY